VDGAMPRVECHAAALHEAAFHEIEHLRQV
jgi:hypothetical protein